MANMYDSGLFTELGDLLGHDAGFYEEPDVSSLAGDITKQSYDTFSLNDNTYQSNAQVPEPTAFSPDYTESNEIDSLLSEGNTLLDKLMADNGLDLMSMPVELADVDELILSEPKYSSSLINTNPVSDLFAQFYEPTCEEYQHPVSPVSTLPSEPSSPVDLFNLETALSPEPTTVNDSQSTELDNLISSLLDDSADATLSDTYDDQCLLSPSESDYSGCSNDYSSYMAGDDNSSCGSSPLSGKLKTARKKKSSTPYSKLPANRKEKKKLQNKEAAIRYRQKKRTETQILADEESIQRERNNDLKSEVQNLEREIMCMKELLSDVFNIHSI